MGILALIAIGFLMPKIVPDIKNRSVDYLGSVVLAVGLVTLLVGFVWGGNQYAWGSFQILSLSGNFLPKGLKFAGDHYKIGAFYQG